MSKSKKNSNKINLVKCEDFNINNFSLPPIDADRSSKTHYHIFPRYKYNDTEDVCVLVTKPIKITKGGIPKLDQEFRTSDFDREFMWLGFDENQEGCKELFNVFKQIDKKYGSKITYNLKNDVNPNKDTKIILLDKKPLNHLKYNSIVKMSIKGGEKNINDKEYIPYERCKLKFIKKFNKDRKGNDKSPHELATSLFVGKDKEAKNTLYPTDIEQYLRWGCTATFLLHFTKMHITKNDKDSMGETKLRDCAFDVSIAQVVIVEEAPQGGLGISKYRERIIDASDDSSDENNKNKNDKKDKKNNKKEESKESDSSDKSSDDSSDDSSSDSDSSKTSESEDSEDNSESNSDSESESDSDKKLKNTNNKKKPLNSDSD
jgi:hypothetical protein